MQHIRQPINYRKLSLRHLRDALHQGWQTYCAALDASVAYAVIFAAIGLVLLAAIGQLGVSPMVLPVAGGFMLLAPPLLVGFFRFADRLAEGKRPRLNDAFQAFVHVPVGLWLIALVCTFLFLIWITDASVVYGFMVAGQHLPYEWPWLIPLQSEVMAFEFWISLMGLVMAFATYCISAFSVPLLYQGRADLVAAVSASVRAAFGNFIPSVAWGLILAFVTVISIILLPLLLVTLPVLAYASYALFEQVFPGTPEQD